MGSRRAHLGGRWLLKTEVVEQWERWRATITCNEKHYEAKAHKTDNV